jgi:predicted transcriptional regulator
MKHLQKERSEQRLAQSLQFSGLPAHSSEIQVIVSRSDGKLCRGAPSAERLGTAVDRPRQRMNRVFPFFGSGTGPQLGPLERQLLEDVWSRGSATVRELLDDGALKQAYTTVMTTLDRLYRKGLLERVAEGRAFRYSARQTPEELRRVAVAEGIRQLLGSSDTSELPLSYLVDALSSHDAQLLDELQLLVERKRRELKDREGR